MPKFVIDEDMPRSTGRLLKNNGYDIKDIRDFGLRGAKDKEIFQFAIGEQAALITSDMGFGNILHFPLGSHFGIVLVHFPNEISNDDINRELLERLSELSEENIHGHLIIIEPGKLRIKRK
ncbi:MAG: DUF5615 family PIN-like protein [Actinomycetota bacterium]|nr:DUF5615 family PIN-like protein [Actinomycetota bacterium]